MEGEANAPGRSGKFFGLAGVLMALCCLAGPAVLGAAAVIAGAAVLLLRHWRGGGNACG